MTAEYKKQQLIKQAWDLLEIMKNNGASASEIADQKLYILEIENIESRPDTGTYGYN